MNYKLIQRNLTESVDSKMGDYITFINRVMGSSNFRNCANSLLPFDGVLCASIAFPQENLKMGVSLMRMDLETDVFALGLKLDVDGVLNSRKPFSTTIFISAAKTFNEMSAYIKSPQFFNDARNNIHKQIKENIKPLNGVACKMPMKPSKSF